MRDASGCTAASGDSWTVAGPGSGPLGVVVVAVAAGGVAATVRPLSSRMPNPAPTPVARTTSTTTGSTQPSEFGARLAVTDTRLPQRGHAQPTWCSQATGAP